MIPHQVFELPREDETPEERIDRTLWRAVVAQAIRDMGVGDPCIALDAMEWLHSDDFDTCCDLAGINAEWLLAEIEKVHGLAPIYRDVMLRKLALILNSALTYKSGMEDISYSQKRQEF